MRNMLNLPESGPELLSEILNNRNWESRSGQVKMVQAIDKNIFYTESADSTCSISAGTGTGKSLGCLAATLPMQKKVIISTSTKSLQNQLRTTEMPMLLQDLKDLYNIDDFTYTIVKGMDNYPCIHETKSQLKKYRKQSSEGSLIGDQNSSGSLSDAEIIAILEKIVSKIETAIQDKNFGELDCEDEIAPLPAALKTKLQPKKCNTYLLCKGVENFDPEEILDRSEQEACTYNYAYAYAMKTDIAIMNTSLLAAEVNKINYADRLLGQETGLPVAPSIIAGTEIVVIDEAHHAPDIVANSLSKSFSLREFSEYLEAKVGELERQNPGFESMVKSVLQDIKDVSEKVETAGMIEDITEEQRKELYTTVSTFIDHTTLLNKQIIAEKATMADRAPFKLIADEVNEEILISLTETLTPLKDSFLSAAGGDFAFDVTVIIGDKDRFHSINTVPLSLDGFGRSLLQIMKMGNPLVEQYRRDEGVEEEDPFARIVLCSATITKSLSGALGLPYGHFAEVESPFDPTQARVYIPSEADLPPIPKYGSKDFDRNMQDRKMALDNIARELAEASGGKTLALTTTKNAVHDLYFALKSAGNFKVLSQYDGNTRAENMTTFANDENSVFVGTKGYWEGVDIPGKALTSVIIDRLSFPTPNDPVSSARSKAITRKGGNPFMEVMAVHAMNSFTQAFGRLQRKVGDKGLVTICDDKVITPRYASKIVSLLPDDTLYTRDLEVAKEWLRECINADADEKLAAGPEWKNLKKDAGGGGSYVRRSSPKPTRAKRVAKKITYHS